MEKTVKKAYLSPTTDVKELLTQKVLCGSNAPRYISPFDEEGEDW